MQPSNQDRERTSIPLPETTVTLSRVRVTPIADQACSLDPEMEFIGGRAFRVGGDVLAPHLMTLGERYGDVLTVATADEWRQLAGRRGSLVVVLNADGEFEAAHAGYTTVQSDRYVGCVMSVTRSIDNLDSRLGLPCGIADPEAEATAEVLYQGLLSRVTTEHYTIIELEADIEAALQRGGWSGGA